MPGAPWGGSEELWSQTAVRLRELGHEVMASVPFWPNLSPRVAALAGHGIQLHVRQSTRPSLFAKARHKAERALGREAEDLLWLHRRQPDLVVVSQGGIGDGLEFLKCCAARRMPFVAICQCNYEGWWPEDDAAEALAQAYAAARKVFCVSQRNLDLLERQIGRKLSNAEMVRNPYNALTQAAVTWPKETGAWRLACVARLEPAAKGQDLLFEELARPRWRERPIEVNLFGVGPGARGLRRLAESLRLEMVRFHGHVENVAGIWEENHILVLLSRYEGLPLALVEAMWCGRPAVVTDIGGNAEMCVNGQTGFVASAPQAALVGHALETAWNARENWQKMGQAARLRAEQILPRDPIGVFASTLISCAKNATAPKPAI
jgi:glycosyltransferase involved in cell wall biosynthesis